MSFQACAEIVHKGDPDRFLAVMAAPPRARGPLFAVYAFNVEVARAPWVSSEPVINEIRLQWWRDALGDIGRGDRVRRHEVVEPLSDVLDQQSVNILLELIDARSWDIHSASFKDSAHFNSYIETTAGGLMWVAARSLGVRNGEDAIRDFGYASGLANWFQAIPQLEARGRIPLVDGTHEAIAGLAETGLERLKKARKLIPKDAYYATRTGWQAGKTLRFAAANPAAVSGGRLHNSEFYKKSSLLLKVLLGIP